jgi:hypothetical protein
MRCASHIAVSLAVTMTCPGAIIDRIAVTVGKQVITESDVIRDLRISAMLDQKPVDLSGPEKRKAADRLVDQTLILQEAAFIRIAMPSQEDQDGLLQQVKAQYSSEPAYRAALEQYHVIESELISHLMAGLRAMRFADLRFRPEVQLSPDDVNDFYNKMVADWKQKGQSPIPTLEASRGEVEKLLADQQVAQALDRWLGTQRNDTEIIYREPAFK